MFLTNLIIIFCPIIFPVISYVKLYQTSHSMILGDTYFLRFYFLMFLFLYILLWNIHVSTIVVLVTDIYLGLQADQPKVFESVTMSRQNANMWFLFFFLTATKHLESATIFSELIVLQNYFSGLLRHLCIRWYFISQDEFIPTYIL